MSKLLWPICLFISAGVFIVVTVTSKDLTNLIPAGISIIAGSGLFLNARKSRKN